MIHEFYKYKLESIKEIIPTFSIAIFHSKKRNKSMLAFELKWLEYIIGVCFYKK